MKRKYIFITLLLILSFFSGYLFVKYGTKDSPKPESPPNQIKEPPKEEDPIKKTINSMTIEEKIGQLVIAGVDGYEFDDNSKRLIENYKVGGFIILGQNVNNTNQLLKLINNLKNANTKHKVPLFLSIDQEGGKIDRMPKEFKRFPTNKIIGQINNSNFSYSLGKILAEEIKAFGFNMDFAPVLDINSNPKNPIIGDRAFGFQEEVVSKLGVKTMKGIQDGNIISSVKHFPGHGDTSVDSHVGLPVVNKSLSDLRSFELIPFGEAIKNNVDLVMVAHILLPKIDAENPASLSKKIITDVLRREMNFKGIVITDDMTMGAVVKNYDIGEAAVKSINAGSDIILVGHEFDNVVKVVNALKFGVSDGRISKERIDESLYRVLKLKEKYNLEDRAISKVDVNAINEKIQSLVNTYVKH